MSNARLLAVADDVVGTLNANTFSPVFTAVRSYQPIFDLQDLAGLQVNVVPVSITGEREDRTQWKELYDIDVGVQQKTDGSQAMNDTLMALVDEIRDYLRSTQLLSHGRTCQYVADVNNPAYDPEHMDKFSVFTSVITVTFRSRVA